MIPNAKAANKNMSGLDGLGWPNPEDEPKTTKTMSDTPETDALTAADQHHLEDDNFFPATVYWRMCDLARTLERERDEARRLCRWAFPRLRTMCHDFDATGTGWCCAEEMGSHPEIFSENAIGDSQSPEQ